MVFTSLITAFIAFGGLAVAGVGARPQAQYPRYPLHTLNYTMNCSKHVHYQGKEHFYCHEGESVAYMSTLKTKFEFPEEAVDANIFIKTKYVFKLYLHGRAQTPRPGETNFAIFAVTKDLHLDDTAFQLNNTIGWNRHAMLAQSLQVLRVRSMYVNLWVQAKEFAGLVYYMNTKDIQSLTQMTFDFYARVTSCEHASGLFHTIGNYLQMDTCQIKGKLQMNPLKRTGNFSLVVHAKMPKFIVKMVNSTYCVGHCCAIIDNTIEENMELEKDEESRSQWCEPCITTGEWDCPEPEEFECLSCCKDVLDFKFIERSTGTCFDPIDEGNSFGVNTYEQIAINGFVEPAEERKVVFVNAPDSQKNFTNLTFTDQSFVGSGNQQKYSLFDDSVFYFTNIYMTGIIAVTPDQEATYSLMAWGNPDMKFACIRFYLATNISNEKSSLYFMLMKGSGEVLVVNSIFNMTFDKDSLGAFGTLKDINGEANVTIKNTSYRGIGGSAVKTSWVLWEVKGAGREVTLLTLTEVTMAFSANYYGHDNAAVVNSAYSCTILISTMKLADMSVTIQSACLPSVEADPFYTKPTNVPTTYDDYISPDAEKIEVPNSQHLICRDNSTYTGAMLPVITSVGIASWLEDVDFTVADSKLYQNVTFNWNSDRNGIIYAMALNKTYVNVSNTYVCYNVTFSTFGFGPRSGAFPGAMSSSRHMHPDSLIDSVNATITVTNSSTCGTGFLAHVYQSSWTISNINMTLELQTQAMGVGFIGLLHNNCSENGGCGTGPARPEDLEEYMLMIMNYTGTCNMSATHGGGNVIGKCDFWHTMYIENVTLSGSINSTRDFKFNATENHKRGWDLRSFEQRCNGMFIGHILVARNVIVSNVFIKSGVVNVTVVNNGAAHGLLMRGNGQKSDMTVALSNYIVGDESPVQLFCHTRDAEGCGVLMAYADGAMYIVKDMEFSVFFTSNSKNGMIDSHYDSLGRSHYKYTGGVTGYISPCSYDGVVLLDITNYTLSYQKNASSTNQVGAVAGTSLGGDVILRQFILKDASGITNKKCLVSNSGRLTLEGGTQCVE